MTRGQVYAGKAVIAIEALDKVDQTLRTVESKFKKLGNTLGAMGRTTFGAGFFGSFASAGMLSRFVKFDDLLLELRVKMGLLKDVTAEQAAEFTRLEKRIRSLGKTTSYTAQEVAEGAIRLAQAGFSGKEIEDTLQSVLDLARGTSTDLGNAARVLANAMRTFNLETTTANEVVSQFVRASRYGTVEIDDLAESLKYASATAVTLGQSLPEVLAIFTLLSDKGMRGSISGTSYNTALSQLAKKAEDIKKELGFDVPVDAGGNLMFGAFLEQITQATAGLDKLKKNKVISDIFNLRGGRSILPITNEEDINRLQFLIRSISSAQDEARQAAVVMDSGLGGSIRRATSAVDDLNLSLQKTLDGPLSSLLGTVPILAGLIDTLTQKYQSFTMLLLASPAIALGAGASLMALGKALKTVGSVAGLGKSALGTAKGFASKGVLPRAYGAMRGKQLPSMGLNRIGQFPTGAASKVPGMGSLASANRLNAPHMRNIGLHEQGIATSRTQAATSYATYKRNQAFAKSGGPFAAQHAQRAAAAKQQFQTAQANKKAAQAGMVASKAKLIPTAGRASGIQSLIGQLGSGVGKAGGIVKNIGSLAAGFGKLTFAVGRFAMSANGLSLIAQVLLMFGNRIPVVKDALANIGNAFMAFGKQIMSIGPALGPVFQLMKASFSLLGDPNTQDLGFAGLVDSLGMMGDVIKGKLVAAFGAFKAELAWVYDTIKLTVGVMWELVSVIFEVAKNSIGNVIANVFESISSRFNMLKDMFGGSETSMGDIAKNIVVGIATVVAELFNWVGYAVINLNTMFLDFTDNFEVMLYRIIDALPGTRSTSLQQAEVWNRKTERKIRGAEDLAANEKAMEKFRENITALGTSNAASEGTAQVAAGSAQASAAGMAATNRLYELQMQFFQRQQQMAAAAVGPNGAGMQSAMASPREQVEEVKATLQGIASALVGSASATRGNVTRAVTENELKKQTKLLEDIKVELGTQNTRSGNVFKL